LVQVRAAAEHDEDGSDWKSDADDSGVVTDAAAGVCVCVCVRVCVCVCVCVFVFVCVVCLCLPLILP